MRTTFALLGPALAFLAGSCAGPGASIEGSLRPGPPAARIQPGELRGEPIERGVLEVPSSRKRPAAGSIEIAFLRFRSRAETPLPPVFYLAGGPGESAIRTFSGPAFDLALRLRELADVVVFDQRGAGESKPSLACPGSWDLPLDRAGDPAEYARVFEARLRACLDDLRRRGIEPGDFNVLESADDADALRRALGYEKATLWGVSYGTHLALQVIRRHPETVHGAILTAVSGPDHALLKMPRAIDEQIAAVGAALAADAEAKARVPDLAGAIRAALARLDEQPRTVEVQAPGGGERIAVAVGAWDLRFLAAARLTQTWGIRGAADFFAAIAAEDYRPLAEAALGFRRAPIGSAMPVLMLFSSGASPQRRAEVERQAAGALLGGAINFPGGPLAPAFAEFDLGEAVRGAVRGEMPVLLISGSLDGRTPPSNAEEVLRGFPRGAHRVIEGASHGYDLFYFAPAVREAMLEFLRAGRSGE